LPINVTGRENKFRARNVGISIYFSIFSAKSQMAKIDFRHSKLTKPHNTKEKWLIPPCWNVRQKLYLTKAMKGTT